MADFQPIELGDRVKDPITGFQGIVSCITTWLHGCVRIGVQQEQLHEGKPVDELYFDQSRLRVVDKHVHAPTVLGLVPTPAPITEQGPGGPPREGAGFRR